MFSKNRKHSEFVCDPYKGAIIDYEEILNDFTSVTERLSLLRQFDPNTAALSQRLRNDLYQKWNCTYPVRIQNISASERFPCFCQPVGKPFDHYSV